MLKFRLKNALNSSDDDAEDSDDGGLLKMRVKTAEEKRQEEADYYEWLRGDSNGLNVRDKNLVIFLFYFFNL